MFGLCFEDERVIHQQRRQGREGSATAYCSVNDDDVARNICKFWIRRRKEWQKKYVKGNEKRTWTREINLRIENKIELKSHTNYNSHNTHTHTHTSQCLNTCNNHNFRFVELWIEISSFEWATLNDVASTMMMIMRQAIGHLYAPRTTREFCANAEETHFKWETIKKKNGEWNE